MKYDVGVCCCPKLKCIQTVRVILSPEWSLMSPVSLPTHLLIAHRSLTSFLISLCSPLKPKTEIKDLQI